MIIRGTTKTITFNLPCKCDQLAVAYITIRQLGENVIEKTLNDCKFSENTLIARLTQEDTLKLRAGFPCRIQIRFRTASGDAIASRIATKDVLDVQKDGVI